MKRILLTIGLFVSLALPVLAGTTIEQSFSALTTPNVTSTVSCKYVVNHTWQYVLANVDTNAVFRIEGSLDGTNWFNMDDNDTDVTQTANGTYDFHAVRAVNYIRGRFVSESGGTAATVTFTYKGLERL